MEYQRQFCGIDIGGGSIKAGYVDVHNGRFLSDAISVPTPQPSTPQAVAAACAHLVRELNIPEGTCVGIAIPAPVKTGRPTFMANLDQSWVGVDVAKAFDEVFEAEFPDKDPYVLKFVNDADAAGLAEATFGAAKDRYGLTIVTTLGTGIGSALIFGGKLLENSELGHLEIDGKDAETVASAAQKTAENLSWEEWAQRLQRYYSHLEMLLSPNTIVVGGGVSENHEKFLPLLDLRAKIVPASLGNPAGIIGAALMAQQEYLELLP